MSGLSGTFFQIWFLGATALVILFIAVPLVTTMAAPTWERFAETLADPAVLQSVWLSMSTSFAAACIALVFGTPLAYLLARRDFPGKKLVESIIDLPIMIPHPVVGIALLSLTGRDTWFGSFISDLGVEIMGTATGIICVLVFVGMPFYVNTVKAGIESVPTRLENVSRSLGGRTVTDIFPGYVSAVVALHVGRHDHVHGPRHQRIRGHHHCCLPSHDRASAHV